MTLQDAWEKLRNEPDYVMLKRFDHSLAKVESAFLEGEVPDHVVAGCFGMTEDQGREMYAKIIEELRKLMEVVG